MRHHCLMFQLRRELRYVLCRSGTVVVSQHRCKRTSLSQRASSNNNSNNNNSNNNSNNNNDNNNNNSTNNDNKNSPGSSVHRKVHREVLPPHELTTTHSPETSSSAGIIESNCRRMIVERDNWTTEVAKDMAVKDVICTQSFLEWRFS
uniref:Uncharacterized protein n=1 Tax=Parascaris equorum TaxID=6256 RepID=A0A914RDY0_PAREQ